MVLTGVESGVDDSGVDMTVRTGDWRRMTTEDGRG
jgi:hypothetical protein